MMQSNRVQMANEDCFLVCTLGNFLVPVLLAAHTVTNLVLGRKQSFENEGNECN